MLTLALPSRIFVCTEPADMRKSFDGLAALVQQHLDGDPLSGDLFVFRSKRGDRVKLLYWNGDGYALWYKKQGAECPHPLAFTEFGQCAHNRTFRLTRAGAVASRGSSMSQAVTAIAPPPRPPAPLVLDPLWNRLTNNQRQQTLATLSSIVVRQLGVPRDEREVRDERR